VLELLIGGDEIANLLPKGGNLGLDEGNGLLQG